jgi:hypothetical protein
MNRFLWGAIAALCLVASTFFVRFWRITRDRFFLLFAIAFFLFAANWTALGVAAPTDETRHLFYVLRLLTFVLIIVAIVDKNGRAD